MAALMYRKLNNLYITGGALMAHGINAAKRYGVDFWSRRPFSQMPKSKTLKILTHRVERQQAKRLVYRELNEVLS
jgi:hypothetical protein